MEQEARPAVKPPKFPKQAEYAANIVVNTALLVVVNNLLAWDVLPFLTQDFKNVLVILNISLAATIIINILFFFYSPDWFIALMRFFLNCVGLAVAVTMLRVFPFDFSAYSGNWAWWMRFALILGIVGVSMGIMVELFKFVTALSKRR